MKLQGSLLTLFIFLVFVFPAKAANLSGQIFLDDTTLNNATLSLIQGGSEVASSSTNHTGSYVFTDLSPGPYRLIVKKDSFSNNTNIVSVSENDLYQNVWFVSAVDIISTSKVTGTVKDYSSDTYSDTSITFVDKNSAKQYTIYTDENGQFEVNLPNSTFQIEMTHNKYEIGQQGALYWNYFSLTRIFDDLTVSDTTEHDFVLPLQDINFTGTHSQKEIATSYLFQFQDGYYNEQTQQYSSEYFYFYALNDSYKTKVLVDKAIQIQLTATSEVPVSVNGPFPSVSEELVFERSLSPVSYQAELGSIGAILKYNSVVDLQGENLTGVCVDFTESNDNGFQNTFCQNAQGVIEAPLVAGKYTESTSISSDISQQDGNDWSYRFGSFNIRDIELPDNNSIIVDEVLILPVFKLEGTIVDERGAPVIGAQVSTDYFSDSVIFDNGQSGYVYGSYGSLTTDADGKYSLYVNKYSSKLRVIPPAESSAVEKLISIENIEMGENLQIVLSEKVQTSSGLIIEGYVKNLSGQPVSLELQLYNYATSDWQGTTKSDLTGYYKFEVSEDVSYSVVITSLDINAPFTSTMNQSIYYYGEETGPVTKNISKNIIMPILMANLEAVDVLGNPIPGMEVGMESEWAPPGYQYLYAEFSGMTNGKGKSFVPFALNANIMHLSSNSILGISKNVYLDQVTVAHSIKLIYLGEYLSSDSDFDLLPDYFELTGFEASSDDDEDGLTVKQEFDLGTNPEISDSDADGILDGSDTQPMLPAFAVLVGNNLDSDNDGKSNIEEILTGYDPFDESDVPMLINEIVFDDSKLRACIVLDAIEKDIDYVKNVTDLYCSNDSITSLNGIQYFTSLKFLDLGGNNIVDVSPLSSLINLETLNLELNNISDISSLRELTKLQELNLFAVSVESLEPLQELTNLFSLSIGLFNISDTSSLSYLTNLSTLWLTQVGNKNLSFLADLTELQVLSLQGFSGELDELAVIKKLESLYSLNLYGAQLTDLTFLVGLNNLQELDVGSSGLQSLEGINGIESLIYLNASFNSLTDLTPISNLINLTALTLASNQISDLVPLLNLTYLNNVNLQNNPEITCNESGQFYSYGQLLTECLEKSDSDKDTIPDAFDNCPIAANSSQINTDDDLFGDVCDDDDDNDGVLDVDDAYPLDPSRSSSVTYFAKNDVDGDGKSDLLWRSEARGWNFLWAMNGTQTKEARPINVVQDDGWLMAGQGDYDADGKSDIFWRNTITGQNFIYLMEGLNIKARKVLNYVTAPMWELRGSGDFNGDGKGDVMWRRVDRG
ncbi:FG-GAP-like repeat-containing protein, partial [Paraglaciecola sp. 25GB23A]|uniref:FG-GAP-like repeat-containing protein n=1 Tax=Paraglaciecola sp. 25GB23A TaxID=3156068 RepID=UPI0032AFED4E